MTINISPEPKLAFLGNDGKPLVGGKLYTYAAGTTTPLASYTSYTGTTANTNPVILDSRGEASVWLGLSRYKFVLKDANDVEIWTQDNLIMSPGADGSGAYGTWGINITGNAATATTATTANYATTAGSASSVSGGYVQSITAGANIVITGTATNPIISASGSGGTVTSVNASASNGFSFSGGPITGSGTLALSVPAPSTAGNVLTSNGSSWVSQANIATIPTTEGALYTYAFLRANLNGTYTAGSLLAGSNLSFTNAYGSVSTSVSGTWKCMGYADQTGSDTSVASTLWVRVA